MLEELVDVQARIADNLPEQPLPDVLSWMNGDDRCASVGMAEEHVAPRLANRAESKRLQGPEHATSGQRRQPGHASYLDRMHADELDSLRDRFARPDVGS